MSKTAEEIQHRKISALYGGGPEPSPCDLGDPDQAMFTDTERAMDWRLYEYNTKKVAGQVLTVVDAVFGDTKQGKAMKDTIKGLFRERLSIGHRFFFEGLRKTYHNSHAVVNAEIAKESGSGIVDIEG